MKHVYTFLFSSVLLAIETKSANGFGLNSKHVNLSLETAFLFDPKETYYDVSLLRTFRGFLDSLQNAMETKMNLRSMPKEHYLLPEFLYELGGYLIGYTDENIKTFTYALKEVVEDYFPAGTVYHKIFYDPRLKAFIKNTLADWAASDPKVIRAGLKAMYQGPTYEETFIDLVEALTCIFDETTDSETLWKLAKKFENFPKKKQQLEKNIDNALSFIIFKRYEKLNSTMRSFVIEELSKVADYVASAFTKRSHDPEFFLIRKNVRKGFGNKSMTSNENAEKKLTDAVSNEIGENKVTHAESNEVTEETIERSLEESGDSARRDSKNMNSLEKNNLAEAVSNEITKENENNSEKKILINATAHNFVEELMEKPLKELAGSARKIFEANILNSLERITKSSSEEYSTENWKETEQESPKEIVLDTAFEINVRKNNKEDIFKPKNEEETNDNSAIFRV
ncbi:hypothetical protein O0L34_g10592 [Tuta absoluta]|nr:hypothetical protein O0L34_g10592 [Tuta absoluta]